MPAHDAGYKLLFSHPQMVRDLLVGFVHEPWVAELDFETLEKVHGSYVSADLRQREEDMVWRVRWRERWLYVYLLLEFQSTVDTYMAVRMMTYLGLLYQDLIARDELAEGGRLPPALPLVLYSGKPRWNAARDLCDLLAPLPDGLQTYAPSLRYLLIDEGCYSEAELSPLKNLSAALFRLESSKSREDVPRT